MERHYAFRYRLEPTAAQEAAFGSYVGCCRFVWNSALEWAETTWRMWKARGSKPEDKPRIDWRSLAGELPVSRGSGKVAGDDPLAWMVDCPKHLLQQTLIDFGRAWVNFWEGRADHPRPHRRWRNDSFRVPEAKSVRFDGGFEKHVGLPKVGRVPMSLSRRTAKSYGVTYGRPYRGVLKHATVSCQGGHWWISLCCVETIVDVDVDGPEVGIDVGVTKPLTLSTGEVIDLPKLSPGDRKHRAKLARAASRRKRGSANRRKAQARLREFDRKTSDRRTDAANKTTTNLTKSHGRIAVEDLRVANMTRRARNRQVKQKSGLNRALLEVAPRRLRTMFEYKSVWYGCKTIAVPAANTSRRCSACNHLPGKGQPQNRETQSRFVCKSCGIVMNADHNAAINILAAARRQTAEGSSATACQVPETHSVGTDGSNRKRAA